MFTYYVVVEQLDKEQTDQDRARKLEQALKTHATQGWELDRIVAGEAATGLGFSPGTFLLILRKPAYSISRR